MQIHLFGQLTEIAGNATVFSDATDTETLVKKLHAAYPAIAGLKYVVAVDKQIVHSNTSLNENSVVALLPPFSGG